MEGPWPERWKPEGSACLDKERQDIPRQGRKVWKMWESSKMNFLYFTISVASVNCLVPIKMFSCLAFGTTGVGLSGNTWSGHARPYSRCSGSKDCAGPTLVLEEEPERC